MKLYLNDIGGLGNRMFIYSFFLSLKKRYGNNIVIFPELKKASYDGDELYKMTKDRSFFENRVGFDDPYVRYKNFFEKVAFYIRKRIFNKNIHSYYDLEKTIQPFLNKTGSVRITDGYIPIKIDKNKNKFFCTGYFQSEKYWIDVSEEVKGLFCKPDLIKEGNEELLDKIQHSNSVCLHVRLGDYVENQVAKNKHYVCTPDYYKKAIDLAYEQIKDPVFFVFTNDEEKTKKMFGEHPEFIYSKKDNDGLSDLQLMIQCKHFIISNSTFSWWAQYLSKNQKKIVYAPYKWFNDGTVTDLYRKDWHIVEF